MKALKNDGLLHLLLYVTLGWVAKILFVGLWLLWWNNPAHKKYRRKRHMY